MASSHGRGVVVMFRLTEKHREFFLSKPESGMGYQCIQQTDYDVTKKYIVFNADLLVRFEELEQLREYASKYASYDAFLSQEYDYLDSSVKEIVDTQRLELRNRQDFLGSTHGKKPHNPVQVLRGLTKDYEGFKRFSAYKNDRRITDQRGLREGTYVTTVNDVGVVPSGLGAVARYALPNPWPAVYVSTVTPPGSTPIEYGTVQPAFYQSGGGIEVFFRDGTPNGTVSGPYMITER